MPICKVLLIAPSTYRAQTARRRDPARLPAWARRDAALMPEIARVFEENFRVYGVRRVWRQLKREGHDLAWCTVARLMRGMCLQGVIRSKPVRTTISDKAEVIRRQGPWRSLEAMEFATLEWVDWFNHRRLIEQIGNIPPAETGVLYYAAQRNQRLLAA